MAVISDDNYLVSWMKTGERCHYALYAKTITGEVLDLHLNFMVAKLARNSNLQNMSNILMILIRQRAAKMLVIFHIDKSLSY